MTVTVIIPMYNAGLSIISCLQALASGDRLPDQVIIVNNNSTDDSVRLVNNAIGVFKALNILLCNEFKRGPGAARNKGVKLAQGDIIAFIDTDCIAHPLWLKNMAAMFENDRDLSLVGGVSDVLGDSFTTMEKFLSAFWLSASLLKSVYVTKKEDLLNDNFVATFNCGFRKSFFLSIDGFDESFLTGEDMDITLRSVKVGGKIIAWNKDIKVYHQQQLDLRQLIKKVFSYGDGLGHVIKTHFSHYIIIRMPWKSYCWANTTGPTVALMTNVPKMLALLLVLVVINWISWVLCLSLLFMTALYFIIKIKRLVKSVGIEMSYAECLESFIFYMGREFGELAGRFYWSCRHKVICL